MCKNHYWFHILSNEVDEKEIKDKKPFKAAMEKLEHL
jgi:hypothetical protein